MSIKYHEKNYLQFWWFADQKESDLDGLETTEKAMKI